MGTDSCRRFKPEICDMILNLVSASRVLWRWTKVQNRHVISNQEKKATNFQSGYHLVAQEVLITYWVAVFFWEKTN